MRPNSIAPAAPVAPHADEAVTTARECRGGFPMYTLTLLLGLAGIAFCREVLSLTNTSEKYHLGRSLTCSLSFNPLFGKIRIAFAHKSRRAEHLPDKIRI